MAKFGLSQPLRRIEDPRLLVGGGRYTDDLVANGLDILTLGQYLQPTKRHLDVAEFITPDQFAHYREEGLRRGLKYVESGPLVRSSYHAERHVNVPV